MKILKTNTYKTAQNLGEPNPLDGRSNAQARNIVNKILREVSQGSFSDEYWLGPKKVFNAMNEAKLDWDIMGSQYNKDEKGVPTSKEWKLEIRFKNNNNRDTILYGTLTAHGAGSVNDPLDRYDMTILVY